MATTPIFVDELDPSRYLRRGLNNSDSSATLRVATEVRKLRSAGHTDVVDFGLGELGIQTPKHIRTAMHRAVEGNLGYTPVGGTQELLEAICYSYQCEGLTFTPDQVMASAGAKQLFSNAMYATLNPGDEVVIPAPAWVGYRPLIEKNSGVCRFIQCSEANDFKVTAEQLRGAINDKTKWLILNSPGNPTGSVYTREELEPIAQVARDNPNLLIYCDEIYKLLNQEKTYNILHVAPDLRNRTMLAGGIAKGYGKAAGLRLGTCAAPKWLINTMKVIQTPETGNPCVLSQAAAVAAFTNPHTDLLEWNRLLVQRRELVYREVEKTDGLRCLKPKHAGGFYTVIFCEDLINRRTPNGIELRTDADVADYLLSDGHVAMVPGCAFEVDPSKVNFLRLSFGDAGETVIDQGLKQMRASIAKLR